MLEINIRYNEEMLRRKSEPLARIKPTTFQIPLGCSVTTELWATHNNEQVVGYFVEVVVGG